MHASYFSCEYCHASASYCYKDDQGKRTDLNLQAHKKVRKYFYISFESGIPFHLIKSATFFPVTSCMTSIYKVWRARTMERILETVAARDLLTDSEKEGILGYSPLIIQTSISLREFQSTTCTCCALELSKGSLN